MIAEIFVDADRPTLDRRTRHPREYQRQMARTRDHGIFFIGAALDSPKAVNVSISNYRQA